MRRTYSKLIPPNYRRQDKIRYYKKYLRYLNKCIKTIDKYIKELENTRYYIFQNYNSIFPEVHSFYDTRKLGLF